jgi:beta-RFAP synthase
VAERVAEKLAESGRLLRPLALRVVEAPAEHIGLGTGTQLSLAVAKLVAMASGIEEIEIQALASLASRGGRSGVGLHGFAHGGLIVEGGHRENGRIPPLLARMAFPSEWAALVVLPSSATGLHGVDERQAFAALPPMSEAMTDRLCRLVLLGILPAVVEKDLHAFGAALEEIQHRMGHWFAPAQGGVFAGPKLEAMATWLKSQGLKGVGQSSWGPTLYGFSAEDLAWREALSKRFAERFGSTESVLWTSASEHGATVDQFEGRGSTSAGGSTGMPL